MQYVPATAVLVVVILLLAHYSDIRQRIRRAISQHYWRQAFDATQAFHYDEALELFKKSREWYS